MHRDTRLAYNEYLTQVAKVNGVASATEQFAVDPSIQQRLEKRLQESSDFLGRVNIMGVREAQGEKLGLGIGSTVASTTDTAVADRQTSDPTTLDSQGYHATQTNYDTHVRYAKIDAWAKFPDFQARMRDVILQRQALDRIMIGFNGTSRAVTSDRVANPLLQDVNKGWLQHYRDQAPQRTMTEGTPSSGKINIGGAGDYKNLDALVYDAVAALVDPWHRQNPGLVAVVSRELLHEKYFTLVNADQEPTEQLAAQVIMSQKRLGGLQAVAVPFFPANTILITPLDNLSIYYQTGGRRRHIIDNPKRDRIENYESSNDAYVVEDFGAGCLLENIEVL